MVGRVFNLKSKYVIKLKDGLKNTLKIIHSWYRSWRQYKRRPTTKMCYHLSSAWPGTREVPSLLLIGTGNREQKLNLRNFPGGPVVKNLPCNAGDVSSIPGQGTKIPHAPGQLSLSTTTRESMYCKERYLFPLTRVSRRADTFQQQNSTWSEKAREEKPCFNLYFLKKSVS